MFGFSERAPKPAALEVTQSEEGPKATEIRKKLRALLNIGDQAPWSELKAKYDAAEPALESNPSALLSQAERTELNRLAHAASENSRATELQQAA